MAHARGVGRLVDAMIRRSVRARFRRVYWNSPVPPAGPVVLAANHHGWHDGYLAYLALRKLDLPAIVWMEELGAFPLFGRLGALPFPPSDSAARAATLRRTLRLMAHGRSLLIFPEGELHPAPTLGPFARSLAWVAERSGAPVVPLGIRYEMGLHERPEAVLQLGPPVEPGADLAGRTRLAVSHLLDEAAMRFRHRREELEVLFEGMPDVNERWGRNR
jgi:1-acyl-sn-glycerol-3-phosphate acyltransferase